MERGKNKLVNILNVLLNLLLILIFSVQISLGQNLNPLYSAYINKSDTELVQFIDIWHTETMPISKSQFQKINKYEREAYILYNDFFNQSDSIVSKLAIMKHPEKMKYMLSQPILRVFVCKKFEGEILLDKNLVSEITDFRPFIDFNDNKVLVKNEKYENLLKDFLHPKMQNNPLQNTDSLTKAEELRRIDFLRKYISFSYPRFEYVIFDKQKQIAEILINHGSYTTYEIRLKKTNNKWTFFNVSTCIE